MEIKRFGNPDGKKIMLLHGNLMCWRQYQTAKTKSMPAWALRFMGQTEAGMRTMLSRIPDNVSLESVYATWKAGLYLYRMLPECQPDAEVTCWYG